MKIRIVTIAALMVFVGLCGFASAYTFDFAYTPDGNEFTSSYTGAIVETFDNDSLLWTWTGDYSVVNGSLSGAYSAPTGVSIKDESDYVTVPFLSAPGAVTVTGLGADYNYFGLWWGSVDDYNTLEFYKGTTLVETIVGLDITNPADGNQSAPSTNLYVNFYDLDNFDSFRMVSTQYAFEVDNIAVGSAPVPEPSTFLLLGGGLMGLAWYGRKRKKA